MCSEAVGERRDHPALPSKEKACHSKVPNLRVMDVGFV